MTNVASTPISDAIKRTARCQQRADGVPENANERALVEHAPDEELRDRPELRGLLFGEPRARNQLIDLVRDRHEPSDAFGSGEEVVACRAFTRREIVLSWVVSSRRTETWIKIAKRRAFAVSYGAEFGPFCGNRSELVA
jgi:hypothetical protein